MPKIEQTLTLRSAFLKIGWAPVIAYFGSFLLFIIGFLLARHSYNNVNTLFGTMKWLTIMCPLLVFVGYLMSYIGFKQAHAAFGITRAGDAFATLKIVFLIFTILSAIIFLLSIFITSNPLPVSNYGYDYEADNMRGIAAMGILIGVIYLITIVYTIVALLIIRSKMKTIAYTTNVDNLEGAYAGSRVIIFCLCVFLVSIFIKGGYAEKEGAAQFVILALDIIQLFLLIYAMVKWVKGWLGAAVEVIRHEVEAEDYTTPKEVATQEKTPSDISAQ